MTTISIQNLQKPYNGETVLDIPHLELKTGESFGLVGNKFWFHVNFG